MFLTLFALLLPPTLPPCVDLGDTVQGWTVARIYQQDGAWRRTWEKRCQNCPQVEFNPQLMTIPSCTPPEVIFSDGFESGDTEAWTRSQP